MAEVGKCKGVRQGLMAPEYIDHRPEQIKRPVERHCSGGKNTKIGNDLCPTMVFYMERNNLCKFNGGIGQC